MRAFSIELSVMLLELLLETHAWAAARPRFESDEAMRDLEKRIEDVMEIEKAQGPSPPHVVASTLLGRHSVAS
jgi:hypothetical protein